MVGIPLLPHCHISGHFLGDALRRQYRRAPELFGHIPAGVVTAVLKHENRPAYARPASWASKAIWVRLERPSLVRMWVI